jgi:signal transduction histidine kinase
MEPAERTSSTQRRRKKAAGSGKIQGAPDSWAEALDFLDEVVRDILDSWPEGAFLDREAAESELHTLVSHLRASGKGGGAWEPGDRLLARRLGEAFLRGILTHWRNRKGGEATHYLDTLAALDGLTQNLLNEHAGDFAARLADPDGYELVVEVAHDLRSPLNSITFLAETLRSGHSGPVTDQQRAQLGLIYAASLGISSIVSDVVDLAHAGGEQYKEEPRPFSLHSTFESVKSLVKPLSEVKGVEFRTTISANDRVLGHSLALNRILANLVINGLKFTEHGWVEVSARPAGPEEIEFSVRDTGRGISEENQKKLYEPFRKASSRKGSFFSSSGLGLSISRRLLLSMGSELELETRPDWGTRFFFTLHLPQVPYF